MMRSGSYPRAASSPSARRPAARNAAVMPRASHSSYDAWPTPIATAHPRTRAATTSRSSRVSSFESRTPRRWSGGGTSAATVTGPAHAPRPTSAIPTTSYARRRSARCGGSRSRDPLTDGLQALDQLFDGDRLEGGGPHRAPRGQHDRGAGHRRLVRRLDHVEEVVLAHEGVLGDDLQAHSLDLTSDLPDALGVLADGRPAVGPQRGEHGVRRHPVSLLAVAGRGAY